MQVMAPLSSRRQRPNPLAMARTPATFGIRLGVPSIQQLAAPFERTTHECEYPNAIATAFETLLTRTGD
jgi:hypothetical protein